MHGIQENDHLFSVRKVPWHGMGTILEEPPKGIEDALKKSQLDWTVEQVPVYIPNGKEYIPVERDGKQVAFANVRSDTKEVLGVVSDRYQILQNTKAFSFLANLIGTDMMYETAGSLNNGKRVWVLARLPEHIDIGGDATNMYSFITNDHTGGRAVKAAVSPVRIVCQNTLTAALGSAPRTYSFPHIGDPNAHIIEARNVLGMTIEYSKQFKEFGDRLASQKITEKKLREVMEHLYPAGAGVEVTDRVRANRIDAANHVVWLFKEGPTVGNAPGSKWSAANAVCEFIDYGITTDTNGEKPKLVRAMDDPTGKKMKVMDLISAV